MVFKINLPKDDSSNDFGYQLDPVRTASTADYTPTAAGSDALGGIGVGKTAYGDSLVSRVNSWVG